jgi:hypothetical protein
LYGFILFRRFDTIVRESIFTFVAFITWHSIAADSNNIIQLKGRKL